MTMDLKSDEIRRQANELWKQAIDQLEEVKKLVLKQTGRLESDLNRLLAERDRLLRELGEQTYRLANQGSIHVPKFVRDTVDNLNKVIDRITKKRGPARKRTGAKKKVTRRRVKKASA
jgi:hypothetical protein